MVTFKRKAKNLAITVGALLISVIMLGVVLASAALPAVGIWYLVTH